MTGPPLTPGEVRLLEEIKDLTSAEKALKEMEAKVVEIRDYVSRMPIECLLEEAKGVLRDSQQDTTVKILFTKTVVKAILTYLKL